MTLQTSSVRDLAVDKDTLFWLGPQTTLTFYIFEPVYRAGTYW